MDKTSYAVGLSFGQHLAQSKIKGLDYQSFAKGEVTPEVAHEIGVKLAEEMWGDRFEVVVSTHLNTQCIHNHFVLKGY